jgi:hypothetical protein
MLGLEASASAPLSLTELEGALRGHNYKDLPPELQSVVVSNIATILDLGFRSHLSFSYSIAYICSMILKSPNGLFLSRILHAPEFVDYVFHFLENLTRHRMESQTLFFGFISHLIRHCHGEFWEVIPPSRFASNLVNSLYCDSCSAFLQSFLSGDNSEQPEFSFPQQLLQQIVSHTRNSVPSIQIIKTSLECNQIAGEFASALPSFIGQILTDTFQYRDCHYIDFLTTLYSKSTSNRHDPHWVRIADAIVAYYAPICEILSKAERFTQFECASGKLFLLVSPDRLLLNDMACQVAQRSLDLLFKFPANSFLHNFAVSAVRLLVDRRTSLTEVIEGADTVDKIIANYSNPQWDGRAFWGQLRAVSKLIEPYVNPDKYPDWDSVVAKTNRQADELINRQSPVLGILPWLSGGTIMKVLETPGNGKFVVWGVAVFLILIFYASCAL